MKILQIMSAEGWESHYENMWEGSNYKTLIGWALIEDDDGMTLVVGLETEGKNILLTPSRNGFDGYEKL